MALACFDSTWLFQPVRSSLKSERGLGQTEGEQNEFQIFLGLQTKKGHIPDFASKVECKGQQFACSEGSRHFNIFQHAQVCRMAAIHLVSDTELRDRSQLGNKFYTLGISWQVALAAGCICWSGLMSGNLSLEPDIAPPSGMFLETINLKKGICGLS